MSGTSRRVKWVPASAASFLRSASMLSFNNSAMCTYSGRRIRRTSFAGITGKASLRMNGPGLLHPPGLRLYSDWVLPPLGPLPYSPPSGWGRLEVFPLLVNWPDFPTDPVTKKKPGTVNQLANPVFTHLDCCQLLYSYQMPHTPLLGPHAHYTIYHQLIHPWFSCITNPTRGLPRVPAIL